MVRRKNRILGFFLWTPGNSGPGKSRGSLRGPQNPPRKISGGFFVDPEVNLGGFIVDHPVYGYNIPKSEAYNYPKVLGKSLRVS